MPAPVNVSRHPLIQHKLARLRSVETKPPEFRDQVAEISRVLLFEATHDLRLAPTLVHTPLTETTCQTIADQVGFVPVLRAGLGMAEAMLEALTEATVWHLGLYRDHATLKPVTYYNKLPPKPTMDVGIVLDPMLATGGSAIAALDILQKTGTPRLIFIGLIAAPEGVAALQAAHPNVPIHLAALDSHLNEVGYIVPGLGDAGDRQFGTA
ncbi:Uracil phosphoribosyltransferase [Gemmata obscuriglobus]|uniref:Uracil phosphoribosyltransferase n=1 Tax=Gemmata obscuriglobus TaxID=114 RepID=A0A2Z3H8X8_9BACT|nr:uracil phosphoribosyltransferase [Gemmata obscuriglobus]AWM37520.1 uracil phosphoribosyltransferase [Gemmata obscuriglobus]QEG29702.1 Uracil phosphoribosyltransferase [Gemmata obscuriglobus]VTS09019.1 uracil phosphoribosyltransferase : Uracil phosphoribosyltransferase OS=Chloroflexus aurantiacus (strain ATCC 29364 / DSM 637 / Y-400-fl) GN=upp PE=3 SV=1: UPRTase [Gemmata obscuriglobus UQM 2246]